MWCIFWDKHFQAILNVMLCLNTDNTELALAAEAKIDNSSNETVRSL